VPDSPPNAVLSVKQTGPLTVTADGSASSAPSNTSISHIYIDFGDGLTVVADGGGIAAHVYGAAGIYTVTVTVIDADRLFSNASVQINVS
jgi:PKD repeat protein